MPLPPKNVGGTPAEKYLSQLCEKSFLSLWSYPNPFRNQGDVKAGGDGKELCDLLVVFDEHVIIFSSKHCEYPDKDDELLNWSRWYKRAVDSAADQLYGAERWLKRYPGRLFLDKACQHPFPVPIPLSADMKVHRIVVAHGASERCQEVLGGTGSLMLDTSVIGSAHYDTKKYEVQPFVLGQVDASKGFVHVFDDASLAAVMMELDTISDFVDYLQKKERFLTMPNKEVFAAGEDDLLAYYLQNTNEDDEHDFVISDQDATSLMLEEGIWEDFINGSQWKAKKVADRISYIWDKIINTVTEYLVAGTLRHGERHTFHETESSLRVLARESRLARRMLGRWFDEMVVKSTLHKHSARIVNSALQPRVYYVYFLFPFDYKGDLEEQRQIRETALMAYCMVAKLLFFGQANVILGIASEAGGRKDVSSFDLILYDALDWDEGEKEEAERLHNAGFFKMHRRNEGHEDEYPES